MPRRQFHLSPIRLSDEKKDEKPKPPVASSQTSSDTLQPGEEWKMVGDIERDMKPWHFKQLTGEQRQRLAEVYTPEQMAAIEAGEKSINRADLANQFAFRRDPMKFEYLDDFSVIEPGVDHHVRAPVTNTDFKARFKNEEDFAEDYARFFREMPEKGSVGDWVQFLETLRVTHGRPEGELQPHSALVPDLFGPGESLDGEQQQQEGMKEAEEKNKEAEEMTDALKKLIKDTGLDQTEIRALKTKALVSHAVVNQTRLGKVRRQYCLSIAGNGNGLLGIGEAKSEESGDAVLQSKYRAIRNMQPIPRYESRTIYGDVTGKVGAVELILMNRPPGMFSSTLCAKDAMLIDLGFGLRCQHLIFEMCRAGGIQDLAARVERSRNPMNTVKAAYEALMSQRNPEDVARARGKKLVDVRKVYYSGRM